MTDSYCSAEQKTSSIKSPEKSPQIEDTHPTQCPDISSSTRGQNIMNPATAYFREQQYVPRDLPTGVDYAFTHCPHNPNSCSSQSISWYLLKSNDARNDSSYDQHRPHLPIQEQPSNTILDVDFPLAIQSNSPRCNNALAVRYISDQYESSPNDLLENHSEVEQQYVHIRRAAVMNSNSQQIHRQLYPPDADLFPLTTGANCKNLQKMPQIHVSE